MMSRYRLCLTSAVLCTVTYITMTVVAFIKYPGPISPTQNWLSDLGNRIDNPQGATVYNTGVILTAVFLAVWFVAGLLEWRMKGKVGQQIFLIIAQTAGFLSTVALIMSALHPIDQLSIHSFWSRMHFMFFSMGFGFSVVALRYHPDIARISLYFGAAAALFPLLLLILGNAFWLEWVTVATFIIYILLIGFASLVKLKD